jgi:Ca2+-binding RTX toxin-like protein
MNSGSAASAPSEAKIYSAAISISGGIDRDYANALATSEHGHLAVIDSQSVNDFIHKLSGPFDAWLGGYQPPGSPEPAGGWTWVTGEPMTYTNWNPGQPDNAGGAENYLEMTGSGGWNDLNGAANLGVYVTEWDGVAYGGPYEDQMAAYSGNAVMYGGDGYDTLFSGPGDDTMDGGSGMNTASYLNASSGVTVSLALQGQTQDTVGAGVDRLSNFDNLWGSTHADDLTGDKGVNWIYGDAGDDTFHSGGGSDHFYGGAGIDTLVLNGPRSQYTITGNGLGNYVVAGPDGAQEINSVERLQFTDETVDFAGATIKGSAGHDFLYGGYDNDFISGGSNKDWLYGNGGNDLIQGGAGPDRLYGGDGDDTLVGGQGQDSLDGGAGDDVLKGGGGPDNLTGGPGADTFLYTLTSQSGGMPALRDSITDFTLGEGDRIDLSKVDANVNLPGQQHFVLSGFYFTHQAGQLIERGYIGGGAHDRLVMGDTNGDGKPDFEIAVHWVDGPAWTNLPADAFVL